MRCDDHLRQVEQRAVGARFAGEHVKTGSAHVAPADSVGQRRLVHQAAAGGVDDDDAGLGLGQCFFVDQTCGLGRLGQVHRDEVGAGQQVVQGQQFDAELRSAGG